tara:strand:+ start:850 stop:2172 length:1323 start_codon:yes stop_codon:yes gene_type:complete
MANNIKSTVKIAGRVGTSTRDVSSTISKPVNAVIDNEVVVSTNDVPQLLIGFESATSTKAGYSTTTAGSSLSGTEQIIIQNTEDSGCAEIMFHLDGWDSSDDTFDAQKYLSCILPAGRMITLPNSRMLVASTLTSAGNNTSVSWQDVDTATNSTYYKNTYGTLIITNGIGGFGHQSILTACSSTITQGLVPGSVRVSFYDAGYAKFGMIDAGEPAQTSTTEPGLAASTAYAIGLTVDGGTTSNCSFTTDSSDITWGSPTSGNGILAKMQADLDNTNRGCDVALVDGDIRFTSKSRAASSAIALGNPGGSGTTIFGVGQIPAVGSLVTVATVRNTEKDNVLWDNGDGTMTRPNGGSGYINYGLKVVAGSVACPIEFSGCPANSKIDIAYIHDSPHSGLQNIDAGTDSNSIIAIYGRSMTESQFNDAASGSRMMKLRVTAWE